MLSVELYAKRPDLGVISDAFTSKVSTRGLRDNVDYFFIPHENVFVDHGQNPAGDSDLRAYFLVRESKGELQYNGFCSVHSIDSPHKFIMSDSDRVVKDLVRSMAEYRAKAKSVA